MNLTGEAEEIVESLAQKRGTTISEVVRRALALAAFFEEEREKGATVLLTYDDGKTLEKVHFLYP